MLEVVISPYADKKRIPQAVVNSSDGEVGIKSNCSSAIKKRKVVDEENSTAADSTDADVEIVETPPLSASSPSSSSSEDVQILNCNTVNALTDYTHPRFLCTRYPYTANNSPAAQSNQTHCPKCFCYVCQIEASKCKHWSKHCHAHDGAAQPPDSESEAIVEVIDVDDDEEDEKDNHEDRYSLDHESLDESYWGPNENSEQNNITMSYRLDDRKSTKNQYTNNKNHERSTREIKITEILGRNLQLLSLDISNDTLTKTSYPKMEGDIPQLNLYNDILIEGIRVGWPFPQIMRPQRQIALHLIKALKSRRHVILESPTGTGKSAAILCSVLAWQRWYQAFGYTLDKHCVNDVPEMNKEDDQEEKTSYAEVPRIYYCSRTHSQVAQMVTSLRKTPYRPKMAILGSRDRMCIHKKLRPRDDGSQPPAKNINLSTECRMRVRNVEIFRRKAKSVHGGSYYNDDHPPISLSSDFMVAPERHSSVPKDTGESDSVHYENHVISSMETASLEGTEESDVQQIRPSISSYPSCHHYRSLTSTSIAKLAFKQFFPNKNGGRGCSNGGELSKLGVHDIEDLVSFGMMPQVLRNIAIYRKQSGTSENGDVPFGILWKNGFRDGKNVVLVEALVPNGEAEKEGSLSVGDIILKVNQKSVIGLSLEKVMSLIRASKRVLLLDVVLPPGDMPQDNKVTYSEQHSPCPYYLSQALAAKADIVFAPYNYILDPAIRKAMGINLANSVVILDEAHNIEDILRESGSGKFTEIEMYEMVVFLSKYSNKEKNGYDVVEISHPKAIDGKMHIADVAHPLLVFVERLIQHLLSAKQSFIKNPGKNGANRVIQDWKKFRTPDDKEFDIEFYGPTGKRYGSPDGCQSFFSHLDISSEYLECLQVYVYAFEKYFKGNDSSGASSWNTYIDRLVDIISVFTKAKCHFEHYMISCVVTANGSLSYAAGQESSAVGSRPKTVPLIYPNAKKSQNLSLSRCRHKSCSAIHGSYCDGSQPGWQTAFVVRLLTPGILMSEISNSCRTLVLASGTLSPIQSLAAELDLTTQTEASRSVLFNNGLQNRPPPLEADHIINLPKQLLAVSIGHFPNGSPLTVTNATYQSIEWRCNLGNAICSVIECIPKGGVLVFLPSYSLLNKCVESWNGSDQASRHKSQSSQSVLSRLEKCKYKVIVEPNGSQEAFDDAKEEYNKSIRLYGSCVLLAVYRGKMSEGVSFNDDFARAVICVGLPLPNYADRAITSKRAYNDEQRLLRKRTDLLPGNEWYMQQAYRALAQALGRCIRHSTDYGTVILMDSRHCHDDSLPLRNGDVCEAHKNLPKWMRFHIRNLSPVPLNRKQCTNVQPADVYPHSIPGGYPGLQANMLRFFQQAVAYCAELEEKQRLDFLIAQEYRDKEEVLLFNIQTGCWGADNEVTGQV